jgi:hypothetical protein
MNKYFTDPKREFLVRRLSLGLFPDGNLASLFQARYAMGYVSR